MHKKNVHAVLDYSAEGKAEEEQAAENKEEPLKIAI